MNFIEVKHGSRRTVFLIGNKAFKIPSLKRYVSFIRGIEENLEERYWYSVDGSRKRNPNQEWTIPNLAEIHYADRFGLLVVMERANTNKPFHFDYDFKKLKEWTKSYNFHADINESNVGYIKDSLVVIDYGYFGGTMDCYIGICIT